MMCRGVFFFFKQKTAYEVKECDWSSDVCSSDLFFLWPHSIDFLEESGVAARIGRRCEATGLSEAATVFEKVMAELRQKEREAILEAIGGESFRTLWPDDEDSSP